MVQRWYTESKQQMAHGQYLSRRQVVPRTLTTLQDSLDKDCSTCIGQARALVFSFTSFVLEQ